MLRLFIIVLFSSLTQSVCSQEVYDIEILHSDIAISEIYNSEQVKRLVGHVRMKHKNSFIDCDSATIFPSNNIEAFGNVKLRRKSTQIRGDNLQYFSVAKLAVLNNNVILTDKKSKLYCEDMTYDMNHDIGYFMKGGKMVNEKTEVTSLFGTYYAKSAEMLFRQNVRVNHPDYQLTSDSLLYNMKYKRSIFKTSTKIENDSGYIFCNSGWYDEQNNQSSFGRNTYIFNTNSWLLTDSIFYDKKNKKSHIYKTFEYHDTASKIHLFGDSAVMYDDDNRILAFKRPTLIIESVENKEPTFVRGNTLDSRTVAGKKRKLVATKNVRLFNKEFQAKSDTMIYTEVDSTMILKKDPIMWHEKDQISGKILKIQMDQKSPKVIYVYQEAFLAQEEDVRTHYNQVSGDTVIIYFENKNISELTSKGSAKSIYYAKEEGKGYLGINSSQSERMKTIFDSSKPSRVIFYDNPKATFIPAKQIDEINRYLPNFKWYDALRPKSKDDI